MTDEPDETPHPPRKVYARPPAHLLAKPYAELPEADRAELDAWVAKVAAKIAGSKPESSAVLAA